MNRGVVYYLPTKEHARPATVSLWSLRKQYAGPVTVYASEKLATWMEQTADRYMLDYYLLPNSPTNEALITRAIKTLCLLQSKYDQIVFLDPDTVICDRIHPLFECEVGLTCLETAEGPMRLWTNRRVGRSRGRLLEQLADRCQPYRELILGTVDRNPHMINGGVLSINRNSPFLPWWAAMTTQLASYGIDDELTLLLAQTRYPCSVTLFGAEWNAIQGLCRDWEKQKRIRHFCSRSWRKMPMWREYKRQMLRETQE